MAKAKVPTGPVPLSTLIHPDVSRALTDHAAKTGMPKTKIIDKALRKLLKLPAA